MINQEIIDFYNQYNEDNRLQDRIGHIEFLTTIGAIVEHVKKGARILDVGAGPGVYSAALKQMGYDVMAVEPVEKHLHQFKQNHPDIKIYQGSALDLSQFKTAEFDAVLLLGPLYHVFTEKDKLKILAEARRIVKTEGFLFNAYCLNEATMIQDYFSGDGQCLLDTLDQERIDLRFQIYSKPADLFELVRLEDIKRLNRKARLERVEILATDLYAQYLRDYINDWSEEVYQTFIDYHFMIYKRADLMGISNHVLDIVMKPLEYLG